MAMDWLRGRPVTRRKLLQRMLVGGGVAMVYPAQLACSSTRSHSGSGAHAPEPLPSADAITAAAQGFAKSLSAEQRRLALIGFDDDQRQDWYYVPKLRKGVPFKQLDPAQRRLADHLVEAGLSARGLHKVATIRDLEPILHEIEHGQGPVRDSEMYYVTLFGEPQDSAPWGWSFEGHHISLNFTMFQGGRVVSTPSFLGANPAEVRHGAHKGLRALSSEEDLARNLVASLDDAQRARAVISESAPSEILTANSRKAERAQPAGIQAATLSGRQSALLMSLLEEYAGGMAPSIAAARLDKVKAAGLSNLHFAWSGALERGKAHYYRIQGPTFLVEYDNTQNDANHVHTVWRDYEGDFGLDLLAEHYEKSHR